MFSRASFRDNVPGPQIKRFTPGRKGKRAAKSKIGIFKPCPEGTEYLHSCPGVTHG